MTRLPLEIWREVFTYACTDGGYTGASLARVCKSFYGASHHVRFRCLSFYSLQKIEVFLDYVRRYKEQFQGADPRVFHLLLSFSQSYPTGDARLSSDAISGAHREDANAWATVRQLRQEEKVLWDHKFARVVPALLDLVAPHLRTLALLQSDGFTVPAIRNPFPRLRELTLLVGISTVLGGDLALEPGGRSAASPLADSQSDFLESTPDSHPDSMQWTPTSATPSTPPARFPALERLHVVCGRLRDFRLRESLAQLPRVAPALTHLRISNATYTHAQCIPEFLCAALGVPAPESECAEGKTVVQLVQMPPGLRNIIVHSVPPLPGAQCSTPYAEYAAFMDALDVVNAICQTTGSDVRVRSVKSGREKHRYWEAEIERHWMERVEDGCGCWEDCDYA